MRRIFAVATIATGCLMSGCGGDSASVPASSSGKMDKMIGPHQAMAYALPDEMGFAEVVNEPEVESRGASTSTSIVVYFLAKDGKSSATGSASDVKFQIKPGAGKTPQIVSLKAEPKSGDPAGANRFVSEIGPYRLDEMRGELNATVDGKPVVIAFDGAR